MDGPVQATYANHVQLYYLPEEVYLDFCLIRIDEIGPQQARADGVVDRIPATVQARMVISREHAVRLTKVLIDGLSLFVAQPVTPKD